MARSRREKKEEAKETIRDIVPTLPIPPYAPAPVRALNLILKGAERLGTGLVELDPLGIITEPAVQAMVNSPEFKLTPELVDLINDDDRILLSDGVNMIESNRFSPSIRGQFSRANLVGRFSGNSNKQKRPRKATKTDKMMSKALEQANKELRKQNGKLRKGVTQADVMTRAHRIRRKLESQ